MEVTNGTTYRTHRVGAITAGFSMIVFGALLLSHSLFGVFDYEIIFSLWPVILIGLGVELLLSNVEILSNSNEVLGLVSNTKKYFSKSLLTKSCSSSNLKL